MVAGRETGRGKESGGGGEQRLERQTQMREESNGERWKERRMKWNKERQAQHSREADRQTEMRVGEAKIIYRL